MRRRLWSPRTQKQRTALARAIVAEAPVIVLDEEASNLDAQSEREVSQALASALSDRTALVIAHRLSTVGACPASAGSASTVVIERLVMAAATRVLRSATSAGGSGRSAPEELRRGRHPGRVVWRLLHGAPIAVGPCPPDSTAREALPGS